MKLRKWILVCCLIMLGIFSGCQETMSEVPKKSEKSLETIVDSPPDYRQEQVVTKLDLPDSQTIPKSLAVGDGKILAAYPDETFTHTSMVLYDILTKESVPVLEIDGDAEPRRFLGENKVLLTTETETYILSLDSGTLETLNLPQQFGVFSHDMRSYYYVKDSVLYRTDLEIGTCEVIKNELNMRFASVDGTHPEKDLLSVMVYPSDYSMDTCEAVLNPENGRFLTLGRHIQDPFYTGDNFYGIFYGNENETPGLYYGSLSENSSFKTVPIPELQLQNSPIVFLLKDSDYVIVQYSDPEERIELWKLGDTLNTCDLSRHNLNGLLWNPVYLPKAELILGYAYNGTVYEPVLIDPLQADFQPGRTVELLDNYSLIDESVLAARDAEQNWECPENLMEVQAQAKRLEDAYEIDILLGSQCQKYLETSYHETVIYEDADCIQRGLEDLERALHLYPDNFFGQFRDSAGNGGVTFLLAQIIDYPLGYADFQADRYYIVVDVSVCQSMCICSTFCHEIWHSTESFITLKCPNAFNDKTWNTLNPDGFHYYETYEEEIYSKSNEWILAFSEPGNAYFTDNYGKVNSMEDKARIMEWVMTGENGVEDLRENRHLNQKLRLMADAIRQAFDTTCWSELRWEEPLN